MPVFNGDVGKKPEHSDSESVSTRLAAMSNFARSLASITVFQFDRPLKELLELLARQDGVKFATLWKFTRDWTMAVAVERAGYSPDPTQVPEEFLCNVVGTHLDDFLASKPYETYRPFSVSDVSDLKPDASFNTKERIAELGLKSVVMIPLDTKKAGCEYHFLNIYLNENSPTGGDLLPEIETIGLKASALLMSLFETRRAKAELNFQSAATDCRGKMEELLERVTSTVLPKSISAEYYFTFILDDKSRVQYWGKNSTSSPSEISGAELKSIRSFILSLKNSKTKSYWLNCRFPLHALAQAKSILVAPISSSVSPSRFTGIVVLCNATHSLANLDHGCTIYKPFSNEQIAICSDIAGRLSTLFDVYLHERSRHSLTKLLAHEILSPAIYIRDTGRRLMNKRIMLDRQSSAELSNMRELAEMQIAICEGIFLANSAGEVARDDKYSIDWIAMHESFFEWRRTLAPYCENFGLDFHSIKIDLSIPKLFFDIRALQAIFLNLGINAIKYAKDPRDYPESFGFRVSNSRVFSVDPKQFGGGIEIPPAPPGIRNMGYHLIHFEDYGIGVPGRFRERIFDLYYRVNGDATSLRPGMGVGLATVRRICQDFYGNVWLDRTNSPTRFTVALPMFLEFDQFKLTPSWRGPAK